VEKPAVACGGLFRNDGGTGMDMQEAETPEKTVILAVDDMPVNLRLFVSILEPQGYAALTAQNAEEAFDVLENEKPELILLDVMMPDMDGFAAARKIKQSPNLKNIPIIFLTARSDKKDILKGFEVGGVDYVTKPFNPPELLARIRTHIELKRAREEIRTLHGLLPICVRCKKIRDDKGYWQKIETYISERSEAEFTHGMCPACIRKLYPPETHPSLYINKTS
jgi:CheY-like chemotaxis protein